MIFRYLSFVPFLSYNPYPHYLSSLFINFSLFASLLLLTQIQGQWEPSSNKHNGNIQWVKYTTNNTSLFASFEEKVELDGEVRTMQIGSSNTNKSISFTLPHFWSIAVVDPSMSSSPLSFFFSYFSCPLLSLSHTFSRYQKIMQCW